VSFWAPTTVVKLPWKFVTLILGINIAHLAYIKTVLDRTWRRPGLVPWPMSHWRQLRWPTTAMSRPNTLRNIQTDAASTNHSPVSERCFYFPRQQQWKVALHIIHVCWIFWCNCVKLLMCNNNFVRCCGTSLCDRML